MSGERHEIHHPLGEGLALVPLRRLTVDGPRIRIALAPGDRPLVHAGEAVLGGASIAEQLRSPWLDELDLPAVETLARASGAGEPATGTWVRSDGPGAPHDEPGALPASSGEVVAPASEDEHGFELLYRLHESWRVVVGDQRDPIVAPGPGVVTEVRPGIGIELHVAGTGIPGTLAAGEPTRGRLDLAPEAEGELRTTALDVGRAGTILVIGSRVDAEMLTRARAMGIRGIVTAGVSDRDLRDFAASESRQRASLHRMPPFALLTLDGVVRHAIAAPVHALLEELSGREVGISIDPPMLLFDAPLLPQREIDPLVVRIRAGRWSGCEGRWEGLAGVQRFEGGVHLEAGFVRLDERSRVVVPLAALERFA